MIAAGHGSPWWFIGRFPSTNLVTPVLRRYASPSMRHAVAMLAATLIDLHRRVAPALVISLGIQADQTALGQATTPASPPAGSLSIVNRDLLDRPISSIRFEGLHRVPPQKVQNNIRAAVGDPFEPDVVKADVARLNRLGDFKYVEAIADLQQDGSVAIIYTFTEQQLIAEVQVVGNKLISDQDLRAVVLLVPQGPRDDFRIEQAKRAIETLYKKRGHYLTTVSIDEEELQKTGILIFKIIEGPRVKIRAIEFEGHLAFTSEQLYPEIKTRTAIILFRKGELDEELLTEDVGSLDQFYKDRGYLDVRVDRRIDLSPDNTEAKVTFLISEGKPYLLRNVQVSSPGGKPLKVFAPEQLAALIELKTGDVYSSDKLRKSVKAVQDAYGRMGYLLTDDAMPPGSSGDPIVTVQPRQLRVADEQQVDLTLEVDEGRQYIVGNVNIQGNFLTRDKVIRRELRGISPGRPFDATGLETSKDRLDHLRLFNESRITVQREDETDPGYRDVLVEVRERNTGAVNFGVAVGSDSGVFGELSLNQTNFDVTDFPESLQELIAGRAFRGAGQTFNASLRPGTELFQSSISLTEPHLWDTEYSGTAALFYRTRIYDQYTESRYGTGLNVGRRLGDIWAFTVRSRVENVELYDIEADAPTEVFADAGPDWLTSLGLSVTRTTIGTVTRPGKGSRLELTVDRFGALGGDIDFNAVGAEYTVYFTVAEDFLGRKQTLKLSTRVGYEFDGTAPTYESFYLGGRSMRGFEFRTISPKGIANDTGLPINEPVGGQWLFFAGAQYEVPIFQEVLTGVLFVDSGTVTEDPAFDPYRVAVGFGIRLYIPAFGQLPIAFDFGFPIVKESTDEEQLFSFSAEFPF